MAYEDKLVTDQLNYSGMLDIVRIRREGFPVHVPAETFVRRVLLLKADNFFPLSCTCLILYL